LPFLAFSDRHVGVLLWCRSLHCCTMHTYAAALLFACSPAVTVAATDAISPRRSRSLLIYMQWSTYSQTLRGSFLTANIPALLLSSNLGERGTLSLHMAVTACLMCARSRSRARSPRRGRRAHHSNVVRRDDTDCVATGTGCVVDALSLPAHSCHAPACTNVS
jgi:hypothetical protein